jgi:phosphopentomutase
MKRVFLIVLDSFGVGELPDAELFGDKGANTLKSISSSPFFKIPNLIKMGLGNIDGIDFIKKSDNPSALFGKCAEKSKGKDTTVGHWEISGVISNSPLPTYPNGFPDEVLSEFCHRIGSDILCNKPYSGTDVIRDYGEEHVKTGKPIVYTSADSVFQIACHEDIVPIEKLYEYCKIAREILQGKHGVGRVIARPFIGTAPNFKRTANRRDFSLEPTGKTMLDALLENGFDVVSVGKIYDIFAQRGIKEYFLTHSNTEGMETSLKMLEKDFCGLCFINLVDFDMLYGHRNDIDGYAKAISEFDAWLPSFIDKMSSDDLLIITADHGCDPGDISTDHTREYTPLLVYKKGILSKNIGVRGSYSDIAKTICDIFGVKFECFGNSFKNDISGE